MINKTKINRLLDHAYKTVPFYKSLDNRVIVDNQNDFHKIPFITKELLQDRRDDFTSETHFKSVKKNEIVVRRTSGSTGKYLKVFWNVFDEMRTLTPLWLARKKYYDILPQDRNCNFYTTNYRGNRIVNEKEKNLWNDRSLGFSKNDLDYKKITEIIYKINEFNPKWLLLQPSMATIILDVIKLNNIGLTDSIKYIEFSGEFLYPELIERVRKNFNCEVGNQYGCNEVNTIAYSCPHGNMHIFESNTFLEIIKDGQAVDFEQEGDIYLTSYNNFCMPFIRYKIGDVGILHNGDSCECGNKAPIIELKAARSNDMIVTKGNEKISPYIFLRPIEMINEKLGRIIKQWQVQQNNIDDFSIKLAIDKSFWGWRKTIQKEFVTNVLQKSLENAKYEFEFSHTLFPDKTSGKLKFFTSNMGIGGKI